MAGARALDGARAGGVELVGEDAGAAAGGVEDFLRELAAHAVQERAGTRRVGDLIALPRAVEIIELEPGPRGPSLTLEPDDN